MKKICFLVDSMSSGGAERVISILSNYFVNHNYEVEIILISTNKRKSFYRLNKKIKLTTLVGERNKNPKYFYRVKLIKSKLKSINPDYIISFLSHVSIYTYMANRTLKIRHIVSERNDPYKTPNNFLLKWLRDKSFKNADMCVFQTQDAMNYFGDKVKNKSIIIKNPVILDKDYDVEFENRKNKIIAVGRLVKQKNYPMLLRVFSEFIKTYPEYSLDIYGDGILKDELIDMAKNLKIKDKVTFKGAIQSLHKQIYDAKMFIMTSKHEGMPNSLIEAMAIGIPSISTDCPIGGPKSIIRSYENGILIDLNDEEGLLNAMTQIASNDNLAKKLSTNAIKINKELSIDNIGKKWIELFSQ